MLNVGWPLPPPPPPPLPPPHHQTQHHQTHQIHHHHRNSLHHRRNSVIITIYCYRRLRLRQPLHLRLRRLLMPLLFSCLGLLVLLLLLLRLPPPLKLTIAAGVAGNSSQPNSLTTYSCRVRRTRGVSGFRASGSRVLLGLVAQSFWFGHKLRKTCNSKENFWPGLRYPFRRQDLEFRA